jgi:hypothetical protein
MKNVLRRYLDEYAFRGVEKGYLMV